MTASKITRLGTTAVTTGTPEARLTRLGATAIVAFEAADEPFIPGEKRLLVTVTPFNEELVSGSIEGPPFPMATRPLADAGSLSIIGGESLIAWADDAFATGPTESPANTIFDARVVEGFNAGAALFSGDEPLGETTASFGTVKIANADGNLDGELFNGWDGRELNIFVGDPDDPFDAFTKVFRGTTKGLDWNERTITINLRDRQEIFRRPLQQATYKGTGGAEGGDDLKGQTKPLCYGPVKNMTPAAIDPALLIYQVHDGAVSDVPAVRDKGVELGNSGQVFGIFNVLAPPAGNYVWEAATGLIRLGASPAGRVTADVDGDASPSYIETHADIVRRIVTTRVGAEPLSDPGDLDVGSFDRLNALVPGRAVFHVPTGSSPTVADALNEIMASLGGWWFFSRVGIFTVGRLEAPSGGGVTLSEANGRILDPGLERIGPDSSPAWRYTINYAPIETVQSADELDTNITDEARAFFSQATRSVSAEDAAVKTKFRLARDQVRNTLFVDQADAQAEADRGLALHKVQRQRYRVRVANAVFKHWLADQVRIKSSRFGLGLGQSAIVVAVDELYRLNQTTLEVWL